MLGLNGLYGFLGGTEFMPWGRLFRTQLLGNRKSDLR